MKLIQSNDRLLQQLQSNVQEILDPLQSNPLYQGRLLSNISLRAGVTNIIPTGLNRKLIGWFATRLDSNSVIWDSQTTIPTPNLNLLLQCSNDCIISLYIF
jgi:hypothetical protein